MSNKFLETFKNQFFSIPTFSKYLTKKLNFKLNSYKVLILIKYNKFQKIFY